MNALAICLFGLVAAADDELLARLDADFQRILKDDRSAQEMRHVAKLLEEANDSNRPTNYLEAIALLRKHRSKAGIPLLLKHMVRHASSGTAALGEYIETLEILTGQEIQIPRSDARGTGVQRGMAELVDKWWTPNKDRISTNLSEFSPEQVQRIVDKLMAKAKRHSRMDTYERRDTAYKIYSLVVYHDVQPDPHDRFGIRLGWFPEELHASMVPFLLKMAGFQKSASDSTPTISDSVPFHILGPLAYLRKNGDATGLARIAASERQASATRLTCALALYDAGEEMMTDVVLSVLKKEKKLELRLLAILMLIRASGEEEINKHIVALLDDPNQEIETAAICAMKGLRAPEALPKLKLKMDSMRPPTAMLWIFDVVAAYRTTEARDMLGAFLEAALKDGHKSEHIYRALSGFEECTGQRWREAGPQSKAFYEAKARQAVAWWKHRLELEAVEKDSAPLTAIERAVLEDYRGKVKLPRDLLGAYLRFVEAAREPTVDAVKALCLPSVGVAWEDGRAVHSDAASHVSLRSLTTTFDKRILGIDYEDDTSYLIRTRTTALRYVKTAAGSWKVYQCIDKRP